jgi:hypothetical protein
MILHGRNAHDEAVSWIKNMIEKHNLKAYGNINLPTYDDFMEAKFGDHLYRKKRSALSA